MSDESHLPMILRRSLPPRFEKIKNGHYTKSDPDYYIHQYLKDRNLEVEQKGSEIVEFLKHKNILVTGATGFLGKLLVEKLLRSTEDIGTIYIIVRSKKGVDPQKRVTEYLDSWVFKKLSYIYPNYKDKVFGISGDFELDGLGLTDESRNILKEQVNIIYHIAATVRFDEKLKKAVKINLCGTQEIIRLAKECKHLEAFVHVSTAFSNSQEKNIGEKFYPPYLDPYALMKVTEELPEGLLDQITKEFIGKAPNTYTFTKQISEDLVRREAIGIPSGIHRPSIVIASVSEPIPSWIDNIYGPVGLIQGAALGLVHVMIGKRNGICDLVPADYTINSLIASSLKVAKDRQLDKIEIFNYVSSNDNPLVWADLEMAKKGGQEVGSTFCITRYFLAFTSCLYWFSFLHFMLHSVPAYILDFISTLIGKKPQLRRAYQKIEKFFGSLAYFTLNSWTFENTNTIQLWNSLNEVDQRNFPFDLKTMKWQAYFDIYLIAMRELLLKDFLDTLDEGRRHKKRREIIFFVALGTITFLSIYYLLNTKLFFIPLGIVCIELFYLFVQKSIMSF